MTGEIIIADTIQVQQVEGDVFRVSASVMGASDSRVQAVTVSTLWNSTAGSTEAKNLLISAYQLAINPPGSSLKTQLITDIGTVIPE